MSLVKKRLRKPIKMKLDSTPARVADLAEFKDRHKGKVGFVLGAGYSLNNINAERLCASGVTFVCNMAIRAVPHCDYYMYTDGGPPYFAYFSKVRHVARNICHCCRGLPGGFANLKCSGKKYTVDRKYEGRDNCEFDYNKLIFGLNIGHVMAHFAWVCGCNPIVLIGMDCNYKGGRKYAVAYDELERPIFQGWNYKGDNLGNSDGHLGASINLWRKIARVNPNSRIVNASEGVLDCFPRVNIANYYVPVEEV
ncbi:MAG: hypothetical protein DRP42_07775 [Tenericutes bacterium]|nr:MAG: hypothetical protein DRP42_07775 [Mycoplasmatota bacterium]